MQVVDVEPANTDCLSVTWWDDGHELGLQAGHTGGRWELRRTDADVDFIQAAVEAVIDGRVIETTALARSRVRLRIDTGDTDHETGYRGLA